jgi:hypothetical protein
MQEAVAVETAWQDLVAVVAEASDPMELSLKAIYHQVAVRCLRVAMAEMEEAVAVVESS